MAIGYVSLQEGNSPSNQKQRDNMVIQAFLPEPWIT